MKIVYLTPPAHGHVNPTLPVVQELVRRGELLICYNTEAFRRSIERTGAAFRAYPAAEMDASAFTRLLQHGNLAQVTGLILRTTEQVLPALLAELRREQPDLLIVDSIALWGRLAATLLQLPLAASISHLILDERQALLRDRLRLIRQVLPIVPALLAAHRRLIIRYGAAFPAGGPLFPIRGGLNLVFAARSLQPDTAIIDASFRFVGPSIDQGTRDEAGPIAVPGSGPLVYISLGTIHSDNRQFYRACFEAFAQHRAQFILAAGRQTELAALGPIPANFIVRPAVPQLQVLERAAAFVTHGGMNSVNEALYYGVPLVLVPHQFEQLLNARCVAARGAGLIVDEYVRGKSVPAALLAQRLEQILVEPPYRAAAGELQRALRATGGYREAADAVQAYLASGVVR